MSLFPGEKVYTDKNWHELVGDGKVVIAGGDRRLLSRIPPPKNHNRSGYSATFEETLTPIPRSEWSDRIKEQEAKFERVSDFQNFPPHDQNGLPTCWSNGPAHAATTVRVMQGLPYVELSANSVAYPISGASVGGNEDTAVEYAAKHGWVSTKLWPNNSRDGSLMNDPACKADRENHKALEWIYLGSKFANYATCALLSLPMAGASNAWSHVTMICDLVEIEPGHFGLRHRNNWNGWGSKNRFGFPGYAVFAEGAPHCCTDSGFALRQATPSVS